MLYNCCLSVLQRFIRAQDVTREPDFLDESRERLSLQVGNV